MRTPKFNRSKEKKMAKEKQQQAGEGQEQAVVGSRSPLARVVPIDDGRIDLFNPLHWTQEDVETIKTTVCPKGIPDNEFRLFILKCQASGMNPLLGEAFCVERNIKIGGTRDNPIWGKAFVYTPGEQGMEGRADDFPDYGGLRAAAVYENDKIIIDSSTGEVSHQWNPVDPKRGRLMGAWAIAYREGRKTPVEYVRLEEYIDTRNAKWASSPATMIVKCARAAALRRAYPNKFDGIFAREEIHDEVDDSQTPAQAESANRDTTDKLAERMRQTAQAQSGLKPDANRPGAVSAAKATVDVMAEKPVDPGTPQGTAHPKYRAGENPHLKAIPTTETRTEKQANEAVKLEAKATERMGAELGLDPNGPEFMPEGSRPLEVAKPPADPAHRDHQTTEPLPHQVADAKKAAEAAEGPKMVYGEHKGKLIASLDGPVLLTELALGESKIPTLKTDAKSTAEQKIAKVRANVDAIKAEMKKRDAALLGDREPGDDID